MFNPYSVEERYAMFNRSGETRTFSQSGGTKAVKVLPTAFHVDVKPTSFVNVGTGWKVYNSPDFGFAAKQIAGTLNLMLQNTLPTNRYITFVRTPAVFNTSESYHVDVQTGVPAIVITANDEAGAFYAAQTVIALVQNHNSDLPGMSIKDKPRFSYRGLMMDASRNFQPKEWILRLLDVMAMFKMNKLHFHLTDDEGWRLEIPGIPELTQIGGQRCHSDYRDNCTLPQLGSGPWSNSSGSGYYKVQDYKAILQYAKDRHIEIIPEIDMPGHSAAAIQAMRQREEVIQRQKMHGVNNVGVSYALTDLDENEMASSPQGWKLNSMNPCLETTYDFVRVVIQAIRDLHAPIMPLKVFHIGGDEVSESIWNTSASCRSRYTNLTTKYLQRQFINRVSGIVHSLGLDLAVWGDGAYSDDRPNPISDYKSNNVYVYTWNNIWEFGQAKRAYQFADDGYKVIIPFATHLYFDQPQEPDPEERGLYWASRVTDVRKVFSFMPDDVFANVDSTRFGAKLTLTEVCDGLPCPTTSKPENILGIQATMFSELIRTEEQFHNVVFPRLLALAERAWHKGSWESIGDVTNRTHVRDLDFESFVEHLGKSELMRLEREGIYYRVSPPGAKIVGNFLLVNTRFPNHPVEYSTNDGLSWTEIIGNKLSVSSLNGVIKLRSRSPVLKRYSRVVEIPV